MFGTNIQPAFCFPSQSAMVPAWELSGEAADLPKLRAQLAIDVRGVRSGIAIACNFFDI